MNFLLKNFNRDYIYNDFTSEKLNEILSEYANEKPVQDALSTISGIFLRCSNLTDKSIGAFYLTNLFNSMENLNSIVLSFKEFFSWEILYKYISRCPNLTLKGIHKLSCSLQCYNKLNDLKIDFSGYFLKFFLPADNQIKEREFFKGWFKDFTQISRLFSSSRNLIPWTFWVSISSHNIF